MVRVEHFTSAREQDALAYLSHAPYANVFLTYLILFDRSPATQHALHLALDDRDTICGIAYFARQIAIAAQDPAAIEAFARIGLAHHGEKMIVGPRTETAAYWSQVRHKHERPRVIRDRQFVMMIDRSQMLPYDRNVVARRARIDEWPLSLIHI